MVTLSCMAFCVFCSRRERGRESVIARKERDTEERGTWRESDSEGVGEREGAGEAENGSDRERKRD